MDEKLKQSIESAGWQVWDPIGATTGGGQCFFCFRTNGIDALTDALRQMTAGVRIAASELQLIKWIQNQWKEGVRLDSMLGVVKVPHQSDERFDREIRILKTLHHPNLIRLYAHDDSKPQKWFVMEPHEGGDLKRHHDEYHNGKEPKPGEPATFAGSIAEIMRRLRGVAEAMAVLHRGDGKQKIIHRDIKPGNILVAADGRWILTDLGIAFDVQGERLTSGELTMSRDWIPDWVVGADNFTERMDIQMLAHVAYYLVSGKKPPRYSQFHLPQWDVRRLQPGIDGIDDLDTFLRDHIASSEEGVKSRTANELVSAIDALLARLSPDREPRLLFSFMSARRDSDVLRETLGVGLGSIPVHLSRQTRRVMAQARVNEGAAHLWFTLDRYPGMPQPLKSSTVQINAGTSQRGGWNLGEPMKLDLPVPFEPGEYLLTLHCPASDGNFMVTGFVAYAE